MFKPNSYQSAELDCRPRRLPCQGARPPSPSISGWLPWGILPVGPCGHCSQKVWRWVLSPPTEFVPFCRWGPFLIRVSGHVLGCLALPPPTHTRLFPPFDCYEQRLMHILVQIFCVDMFPFLLGNHVHLGVELVRHGWNFFQSDLRYRTMRQQRLEPLVATGC